MTGPEHYREAERLAEQADEWLDADHGWKASMSTSERLERRAADLAAAQVHATLALAAATALSTVTDEAPMAEFDAWSEVAGVVPTRPAKQDGGDRD